MAEFLALLLFNFYSGGAVQVSDFYCFFSLVSTTNQSQAVVTQRPLGPLDLISIAFGHGLILGLTVAMNAHISGT